MPTTALVTGASHGIGAELSLRLASGGAHVALVARDPEALAAVAERIRGAGGRASVHPLDVSDPAAVTTALQRIDDELGGLDLVIANAGVATGRWAGKLTWEDCAGVVQVNVIGAVATLLAVLPRMVARRRGHLVGVSSIAAVRPVPRLAAYGASKAFLSGFLGSLRLDLAGTGVAVTDVRPGYVRTRMLAGLSRVPPFTVDVERAARVIARAIERRRTVVTFPLPLALGIRLAGLLPASAWSPRAKRR
jgi:short-subunit dehydrogenase